MINPNEISEVLKQQLRDVNAKVSFEEVGTVLEVGDGVAHVYGLDNVLRKRTRGVRKRRKRRGPQP